MFNPQIIEGALNLHFQLLIIFYQSQQHGKHTNINNIKTKSSIFCVNKNLFNVFSLKLTQNMSHNSHHILAMAG